MKTPLLLPAPTVIRDHRVNYRIAAKIRARGLDYAKGDGYWAKQVAAELRKNLGYYRVEIGGLGRPNEREPGVIYRRPATSGQWGKSSATRLGPELTYQITLSRDMATYADLTGASITHPAPKGMIFLYDDNGVYLWRVTDEMDYHPTREDWTATDFARRVRGAMDDNKRRRKAAARCDKQSEKNAKKSKREQARREKLLARRVVEGIRVTLDDSRRAGNCVEGSLRFAERKLGITRAEILAAGYLFAVDAAKLLAVANGDRTAVDRAIHVAWLRETTVSI